MSTEFLTSLFWNSTPTFLQTYVGVEPIIERLSAPDLKTEEAKPLLHRLAYRPSVCVKALRELPYLEPLLSTLSLDPMVALKLVAEEPRLLAHLNEQILPDVEASAALLMLPFTDPLFPKLELPGAKEFFRNDPDVLKELGDFCFESVLLADDHLATMAEKYGTSEPGWAVYLLRNLEQSDEYTVPSALVELLSKSEFYSLCAARILRDKAFGTEVYAPVLKNIRSARYTYRALAEGLDVEDVDAFSTQLRADPAWLIEHLSLNDAPFDVATEQYRLACAESYAHPLIDDLHDWYLVVSTAMANRAVVNA